MVAQTAVAIDKIHVDTFINNSLELLLVRCFLAETVAGE
jgi:hypothetical protein